MLQEFRDFIVTGDVIDLAVVVRISGVFSAIVTSFTNDLLMPVLSLFTGGIDFFMQTKKRLLIIHKPLFYALKPA
ncbi:MAG: MscL family protein [Chloroflexota bacterium]